MWVVANREFGEENCEIPCLPLIRRPGLVRTVDTKKAGENLKRRQEYNIAIDPKPVHHRAF